MERAHAITHPGANLPTFHRTAAVIILTLLLAGCGAGRDSTPVATAACPDTFVRHDLDFVTTLSEQPVHLYDSNGAGVAVGDLDRNGYADTVLANLNGPKALLLKGRRIGAIVALVPATKQTK